MAHAVCLPRPVGRSFRHKPTCPIFQRASRRLSPIFTHAFPSRVERSTAPFLAVGEDAWWGKIGLRQLCGHLFLCRFPVLPDRDDRHVFRPKVLVQNTKRIQAPACEWTIYPTGSPRSCHGEDTGAPNWWHRSAVEAARLQVPGRPS